MRAAVPTVGGWLLVGSLAGRKVNRRVYVEEELMSDEIRKIGEEYQRLNKDGFDAAVHSFSEVNKGFQAIAAEVTVYSKKTFDDSFRALEQVLGAKSVGQAIEIQSQYAKKAYDTYVAEVSKLGEMYVALARGAYKPVEQVVAKNTSRAASSA
jgi:phasin family protein